jgi:hypothetical protein
VAEQHGDRDLVATGEVDPATHRVVDGEFTRLIQLQDERCGEGLGDAAHVEAVGGAHRLRTGWRC